MSQVLDRRAPQEQAVAAFARDVGCDLLRSPKRLQPKYLYDDLGSALFDAICRLPWYPVTRAEMRLLRQHGDEVLGAALDGAHVLELGCGSGEKLRLLVEAFVRTRHPVHVDLIDISEAALRRSEDLLADLPGVSVTGYHATYEDGLQQAAEARDTSTNALVLLLGSNIGNFDPPEALQFLQRIRESLRADDHLLLGVDLTKPPDQLLLAYDDPLGVTAAFNKNLLVRINRDLQGDFDLNAFDHRAVCDEEQSRVEMHLVSRRAQTVRIAAAGCEIAFEAGESIWTESSYKYEPDEVEAMASLAGFRRRELWIEPDARFSLTLLQAT
jgi:L-histidine N-alpha-methyltransferase